MFTLRIPTQGEEIEGAAAAPRIARILERCAVVKILATSRLALHLYGEQEFPVPPLPLPAEPADANHPLIAALVALQAPAEPLALAPREPLALAAGEVSTPMAIRPLDATASTMRPASKRTEISSMSVP